MEEDSPKLENGTVSVVEAYMGVASQSKLLMWFVVAVSLLSLGRAG